MLKRLLLASFSCLLCITGYAQLKFDSDGIHQFAVLHDSTIVFVNSVRTEFQDDGGLLIFPNEGIYRGDYVMPKQVAFKGKYVNVHALFSETFKNCPDLESITIEDSVDVVGLHLDISGCKSLKQINIKPRIYVDLFHTRWKPIQNYQHPYDFLFVTREVSTMCPTRLLNNFISTTDDNVHIDGILQNSVRYLVFNDMAYAVGVDTTANLKKVTVQKTIKYKGKQYPVKAISTHAFEATNIQEVVLPTGLEYIGESAFKNCKKLHTIKLPNTVEFLGTSVFADCVALKNVTLSPKLSHLPEWCFRNCSSLAVIDIPASVKTAGYEWNSDCPNLKNIVKHGTIVEE